jgi:hypothetical protein
MALLVHVGSVEVRSPLMEADGLANGSAAAGSVRGAEVIPAPSAEPTAAVSGVGDVGRVVGVGIDVFEVVVGVVVDAAVAAVASVA